MTDKTTRAARRLAESAEAWADQAEGTYQAAHAQGWSSNLGRIVGAAAVSAAYSLASLATMFTQDD